MRQDDVSKEHMIVDPRGTLHFSHQPGFVRHVISSSCSCRIADIEECVPYTDLFIRLNPTAVMSYTEKVRDLFIFSLSLGIQKLITTTECSGRGIS